MWVLSRTVLYRVHKCNNGRAAFNRAGLGSAGLWGHWAEFGLSRSGCLREILGLLHCSPLYCTITSNCANVLSCLPVLVNGCLDCEVLTLPGLVPLCLV